MNLLFEAQRDKPAVMALVFPEMEAQASLAADCAMAECDGDRDADAQRFEAEQAAALQRAREAGYAEGVAASEQLRKDDLEVERSAIAHLCTGFAKERKRYFAEIESEVVKLALAIAGRVLQRESAMDATLLKGVVKVALAKVGDARGAVLHMHPEDVSAWHEAMKHSGLEIAGDGSMKRGALRLEAAGSVAELGVAEQLVEIERGFFDLLARRPA